MKKRLTLLITISFTQTVALENSNFRPYQLLEELAYELYEQGRNLEHARIDIEKQFSKNATFKPYIAQIAGQKKKAAQKRWYDWMLCALRNVEEELRFLERRWKHVLCVRGRIITATPEVFIQNEKEHRAVTRRYQEFINQMSEQRIKIAARLDLP